MATGTHQFLSRLSEGAAAFPAVASGVCRHARVSPKLPEIALDIKRIGDNEVAVVWRGRIMITPENRFDSDEIWNSMSDPPHRRAVRRKRTPLHFVSCVAALPWVYVLVELLRKRLL